MVKKHMIFALLCTLSAAMLSGCFPTGEVSMPDSVSMADNIDGDFELPEKTPQSVPEITLKLREWDNDELKEIFLGDRTIPITNTVDQGDGITLYIYSTSDNASLSTEIGKIMYTVSNMDARVRLKWMCGQLLYIITATAAYYIFLLMLSLLFTVFSGELSLDWGRTLNTLAASKKVVFDANAPYVEIPIVVVTFFKPLQAVWFTFLMSWFGGVFLGMLVLFCNLISSTRALGVLIASAFVIISSAIENEFLNKLIPFSPISWTTLDNIDVGGLTTNPSFLYCVSVYVILLAVLTFLILIFGRKKVLM